MAESFVFLVSQLIFMGALALYFITAMQWYSYKIERVVLHYNRYDWHLFFCIIPLIGYYLFDGVLLLVLASTYAIVLGIWYKKLDKKLVLTARVKRFFLFLILAVLFFDVLCFAVLTCHKLGIVIPLFIAHTLSLIYEKILFLGFKKEAQQKLHSRGNLKVVAITASYGKTSIKNFLAQILNHSCHVYKTPRSVNTLGGIIKDINESLPQECDVYIVEAGARLKGDIDEIARCVNPHIAVVGCIGEQHIEYFKTLENIRNTKMELLHSNRLEKAFVHESANVKADEKVHVFGPEISNVSATLDGLSFDMLLDGEKVVFLCKLLGAFNAINIAAAIHVAYALGMDTKELQTAVANLEGVEHRLQRMEAGGKLIIDDSFNGNLEGMLSSYDLVATHQGRKVIITPGIVESTEEANIQLAKKIDDVFDIVIITGKSNAKILETHIQKAHKILLSDKSKLQEALIEYTQAGDVILFSNDAPSFI